MILSRPSHLRLAVALVTIPLVLLPAAAASASHNRAVTGELSITGNTATWVVQTAWRDGRTSSLVSDSIGDTTPVTQLASASDAPNSGTSTGVDLTLTSYTTDLSSSLFDVATENLSGDLSTLGDGIYEIFASNSARATNQNAGTDFAQWVRFTKTGSTYNVSPAFTAAPLYQIISPTGGTVVDYTATDPEGGAVNYALVTDRADPYRGADALACSTFAGGILTVGASLCTGGDVFADIYTAGSFWVVKVVVTDAEGLQTTTDTTLRVLTAPEPYIDDHTVLGNGTSLDFTVIAEDTPVDSWSVECVGTNDPMDVITATGTATPISMTGMTVGEDYTCEVTATNAAGTATSTDGYTTGPIVLDGLLLKLDLAVGDTLSGTPVEISGANLLADSAFTLEQRSIPVVLLSGVAAGGTFLESLVLPSTACVPGAHTLILTGVGADNTPRVDQVWYEIGSNCDVLQFSRTGAVTVTAPAVLAATGSTGGLAGAGSALGVLLLGIVLTLVARGRKARRAL